MIEAIIEVESRKETNTITESLLNVTVRWEISVHKQTCITAEQIVQARGADGGWLV